MCQRVEVFVSRRAAVRTGILFGAAAWLSGCQGRSSSSVDMPGPVYPDMEPLADPLKRPVVIAAPKPAPAAHGPIAVPGGVIPRSRWTNARPLMQREAIPMNGVARITVHHDSIPSQSIRTEADVARRLESIRRSHVANGWVDIGYHYAIDPQGRVWEARTLSLQGAHVKNNNEHNLGVMLMGNFDQQRPSPQATAALDRLLIDSMRRYHVAANRVYTHREIGQSRCPGDNLHRYMVGARSSQLRNA